MSKRSSLESLPQGLQVLVKQLWGEGATIDQLTGFLQAQIGAKAPSRASVGRYAKRLREEKEKAQQRNAYLRELLQSFPPEGRENLTFVLAEQLKGRVLDFMEELEQMREFRCEAPDKYAALLNNLGRSLQSFELALNNNQKRKHQERKALLDEVRAKLAKDKRIDQSALLENMANLYG